METALHQLKEILVKEHQMFPEGEGVEPLDQEQYHQLHQALGVQEVQQEQ